ncbi:hypothetical protein ACF061_17800 [Streptomyces sp. NPDC015220]|uniref:hypothetical protein n=1 Tax=Streptomyces sp. NPDC015220 TaxID=3364947 RepID=UPI0036F6B88C
MSGRADSETPAQIPRTDDVQAAGARDAAGAAGERDASESAAVPLEPGTPGLPDGALPDGAEDGHEGGPEDGPQGPAQVARRARWTAAGAAGLLTLAGLAASLLRLAGSAPVLVAAAYAAGAAVCAVAALLGSRGRTRRALWLMIAGVMVMALGDQSD